LNRLLTTKWFLVTIISLSIFLIAEGIGCYLAFFGQKSAAIANTNDNGLDRQLKKLRWKNATLKNSLASLSPKGINIVVDTARNVLYLKKGNRTIKEAIVSCGSGNVLEDPSGKKKWIFDTPRGEYSVKSKLINPDWIKPDWAFIEEGEAIPQNLIDRVENGVLGKYALGFGNGFFIHGTLYTRLLGRNVSHGCIRVGDKDLEDIYKKIPIGARIAIF
jgi:lipoprotein-anchoring transpeptidase ErfK/SrfK